MSDWQSTTCMRCAVGCGLVHCGDEGGTGVADARGDSSHPTNGGKECQRGLRETVNPGGERLTTPLVRRGATLQPTDWGTALGIVGTRIIEAISDDPGSVAVLGSGQQTTEAAYALGKVARGAFGTPNYDANTRLCMASAVAAYDQAFGGNAPPPTYDDIPAARTHVVWGANPATAHPVLFGWITESAREPDSQLIVVDPVETQTAREADVHVQPEPGTDLALVRAVLAQVVDAGRVDESFVEANTTGFDQLVESLPPVSSAAATTGVSTATVRTLADAFAQPTLLYWGMGVNQSIQGTATARGLIDCCLATGNLGPGCGPFSLTGQANSMGSRVVLSKDTWPGHRDFHDSTTRKRVASTWDVPVSRLPDDPGPGYVGVIDRIAIGDVDVCWTVATNPASGTPDASRVRTALADTFLVVQDSFHSETVSYADVVLPAATWGETSGTAINMERRLSRITSVAEPPGSARQDLDVIAAVGNQIHPGLFDDPPLDLASVFDELSELTAGSKTDLSGISYDRLSETLAVRWPAPDADSQGGYQYYDDGDWSFDTDSGLARFSTATHSSVPEPIDEEYPLTLTTGRLPDVYNTGVRTSTDTSTGTDTASAGIDTDTDTDTASAGIDTDTDTDTDTASAGTASTDADVDPSIHGTLPTARMNAETIGEHLAAFDRGRTIVESRRGRVPVAVVSDSAIPPGVIWLPIHDPAVNELTLSTVDPESDEPNLKQCAVTVCTPARPWTELLGGASAQPADNAGQ